MRRMLVVAVAATVLTTTAHAQAATVEQVPTYQRATSVEWHWYLPTVWRVWYTRTESERIYRHWIGGATAGAIAAYACDLVPNKVLERVCTAAIAISVANFVAQIHDAHRNKTCLTYTWPPTIWMGSLFQDRGGKRCRP